MIDPTLLLHRAQLAYTLSSHKYLSNFLPEAMARPYDNTAAQISNVQVFCLIVDIWTSLIMHAYIGITCHIVDNYKLQTVMLACGRFTESHNAENILANYLLRYHC